MKRYDLLVWCFITFCACIGYGHFENLKPGDPVLIINTLDGIVSALDINNNGEVVWSTDFAGPFFSSSMSKLAYRNNDGKIIQLIPSMNGGLFQFDGENLESLAWDPDLMLSSSFRLENNNDILVGGKKTETTGVDLLTGRLLYSCSMDGCHNYKNDGEQDKYDPLIIKKQETTLRY